MIINHNLGAMNANRMMSINANNASNSMEKLSSGLRINKAGDDAAGLAISEKMRGQIRGLDQASANAQDSISLLQTAEGALNETHSILQRMRELSVQASNDTLNTDDRTAIQTEVDQLSTEIDRISTTTEFNTKKLLNGDSGTKVIYASNPKIAGATSTNDNVVEGSYEVSVSAAAEQAATTGSAFSDSAITVSGSQSIVVNGKSVSFTATNNDASATAASFISAVNNAGLGITATGDEGGIDLTTNEYGVDQTITITASALTQAMGLTTDATTSATDSGVNVAGTIGGNAATGSGRTLVGTVGDTIGLKVELTGTAAATVASAGNIQVAKNALTTHIGANEDQTMTLNLNSMGSVDLGVDDLDVSTQSGAENAISTINNAIQDVSNERAKLGAYTNRLEHTIANLGTSSENLTSAESRIRDVDMAKEMSTFSKNNILSQAAQAMLAQANTQPQQVLQLLR